MTFKEVCAAICAAGQICAGGQVALAQEVPDATEVANLKMMFEEERMAHDLYIALGEKWRSRKFDNISRAETRHNSLVAAQLDRLGVERPDASVSGKYADPEIQKLYDSWLEQGMKTQADAFRVGAELERRDIADLEKSLAATNDQEVREVYGRLLAGSKKHLAAFEKGQSGNRDSRNCPMKRSGEKGWRGGRA